MKFVIALFSLLSVTAFAAPLPSKPLEIKNILKCFSAKHGTLWVSFGHMIKSGESTMIHFPTEIAVFNGNEASRNVYFDVNEALKVDLQVRPRAVHLGFNLKVADNDVTHLLQIMEMDTRSPNSYAGNWTVTSNGSEVPDAAYCSVF